MEVGRWRRSLKNEQKEGAKRRPFRNKYINLLPPPPFITFQNSPSPRPSASTKRRDEVFLERVKDGGQRNDITRTCEDTEENGAL